MNKGKALRTAVVGIGALLCILFVFLLLPRLLVWFLPFVLAFVLFKIIEPLVSLLEKKCRIPRTIGSVLGIVAALSIIGGLVYILLGRIWREINDIIAESDVIWASITEKYYIFRDTVATRLGFAGWLDGIFADFGQRFSEFAAKYTEPAIRGALGVVMSVPSMIVFAVVFILATFFMSSDKDRIREGLRKHIPQKVMDFISGLVDNVFSALGAYVKAQLILICITFFELTIGFLIIGGSLANYALLLAFGISIIDAIPILGTGTVLIPWGVYALIVGDVRLGIMLIVLYLICLAVRQLTEPRLVAHQIGIHPLMILMVMYTGLRVMGFFGMIIGPVLALVVKKMYTGGVFSSVGSYIQGKN